MSNFGVTVSDMLGDRKGTGRLFYASVKIFIRRTYDHFSFHPPIVAKRVGKFLSLT